MTRFRIENIRVEHLCHFFKMISFDLVTARGRVELMEHVTVDTDGNVISINRSKRSNIERHLKAQVCSVFDMSRKPPLMPDFDFIPFDAILDAVDNALEEAHLVY